jgi:predicted AAA+ superfamily ATPase
MNTQPVEPVPAPLEFDPVDIQREAAMFYGLFLRGHSPEDLKRDIEIPWKMVERWMNNPSYDGAFRENVKRIYRFRKQVLAVFEELVHRERVKSRPQ